MKRSNPLRSTRAAKKQNTSTTAKMATRNDGITTPKSVFFWRETHPELGYLSQWYYYPMRDSRDQSKVYFTAEHYMMHHKALLFNDPTTAAAILTTPSPRGVRTLGRKVPNFSDKVWNANRLRIVEEANVLKFTVPPVVDAADKEGGVPGSLRGSGNPDATPVGEGGLRALLLATGERELVEASPMDRIWGVGVGAEKAEERREKWGLNLLGRALVVVRERLRAEEEGKAVGKDEDEAQVETK